MMKNSQRLYRLVVLKGGSKTERELTTMMHHLHHQKP